ncbi:histidine kinase [Actinoplanes sp. NBRC 101535]|nr:histidine kinase [Actinoplanes sp. NBRC 101535]
MLGVDQEGVIVFSNRQASHLFGYDRGELAGRRVEILLPEHMTQRHRAIRQRYFTAPEHRAMGGGEPLLARRKDGTVFPAEISLSGLSTDSGLLVSAAVRDVSERLRMESERERLREEAEGERLQNQLQRAQKMESLGQLAGGIAHDFNNLLSIIMNFAEFITDISAERLASSGGDPADVSWLHDLHRDGTQIQRAAHRGASLTRQLLAFARQDVARPVVVDVSEVVRDVEAMLLRSLGEHIVLNTRCSAECKPVLIDAGQLEQILVNLAVNARDAMPDGGGLIIETADVVVDGEYVSGFPSSTPGEYVRLRVSDTGTGMPREVIDRVFEPFFTTKAPGRGTGLGLAMVYGIVTSAGGTVGITSDEGVGTTIDIMLPVTERPAYALAADETPVDLHGSGQTVLLLEDEPALRQVCRRLLLAAGYRVVAPESTAEAVTVASEPDLSVDLLLTDVVMPGIFGSELAGRIRAVQPHAQVLFMSGYATPFLADKGFLDPDTNLLEKPFTRTELLTAVRHAVSRHRPATPSLALHAAVQGTRPGSPRSLLREAPIA